MFRDSPCFLQTTRLVPDETRRNMAQLFFLLTLAVSTIAGRRRFVDLTHALDTNAVYWPGSPSFKFNILSRQQLDSFW